jgi:hypothetical protein
LEINVCNTNTQHGMKGFKIQIKVRKISGGVKSKIWKAAAPKATRTWKATGSNGLNSELHISQYPCLITGDQVVLVIIKNEWQWSAYKLNMVIAE